MGKYSMKPTNKFKLGFFLMAALMLTGCKFHSSTSNPTPTPNVPPVKTALQGKWESKCYESLGAYWHHYKRVYSFDQNQLITNITYYDDALTKTGARCADVGKVLQADFVSNFSIGKVTDPGSSDEHTNINITKTKVVLTPLNASATQVLNNNVDSLLGPYKGYGIKTWKLNTATDVSTNADAIKALHINTMMPDIYNINKHNATGVKGVVFGNTDGNLDPDGRPITLWWGGSTAEFVPSSAVQSSHNTKSAN